MSRTTRAWTPAIVRVVRVTRATSRSTGRPGVLERYTQRLPGTSGKYGLSTFAVKFAGSSCTGWDPWGSGVGVACARTASGPSVPPATAAPTPATASAPAAAPMMRHDFDLSHTRGLLVLDGELGRP